MFYDWRARYGLANEHNALVPRDCWLEDWEKQVIVRFHLGHPLEVYRRLAFMMLILLAAQSETFRSRERWRPACFV